MREYFVWLAKLLTVLVLIFLGIPLVVGIAAGVMHANGSLPGASDKTVAVIELGGEIHDGKEIVEQLYKQARNDQVKGIILRVDSPGGAVGPSQDIYTAVTTLKNKKPIVASFGSLAASGGLYSALGASKIFAEPGTLTGSIGVIMQAPNLTQIASKVGFNMVTIKSGKLKDIGNPFRDMTPEEAEYLQSTIGSVHQQFMKAVSESRHIPMSEVEKFADGRVITGERAKEIGLVDELGDVYKAAHEIFVLLKQPLPPGEEPELFYPKDKLSELKQLLAWVQVIPKMFSSQSEMKFLMF